MNFEFATATRIVFGPGSARRLGELCAGLAQRFLVVTGRDMARHAPLLEGLKRAGCRAIPLLAQGEPTLLDARNGASFAREAGVRAVISIGGGSVVDLGKAIAALATQPAPLTDYIEVIGKGRPLDAPPLRFIAVPTTAGTGAEVTRNAVLASTRHRVKASLRHASMLPALAIVDPELALTCPPAVTAASGMDALTQCLEALVCTRANPLTDALCAEGIRRAARSLERVVADGADLAAREDMALVALHSGLALANAGLGAVHGLAAPIGGIHRAPHGAVCAALLAPVWAANLAALDPAAPGPALEKFRQAACLLTGKADARPEDATTFLQDLAIRLRIPGLATHGLRAADLETVALQAAQASSMKANPAPLSQETLTGILRQSL